MKTKYSDRMEKVRKARSLNDVLSIVKDIAKDVMSHKKVTTQMVATAATKKIDSEELTIDHDGNGTSKLKKKPVGKKSKIKVGAPVSGIKLAEFVAPPIKQITEQSAMLHELHDNEHALEAAEAMIRQSFARSTKQAAALKAIQALQTEVHNTIHDAMEMLQGIGSKHLPPEMEALSQALFDFLLEHIQKTRYDDIRQHVFVVVHQKDEPATPVKTKGPSKIKITAEFEFSSHFVIENLNTEQGYKFPEYDMVLTGIVDRTNKIRFFLNGLPDFKPPGKYMPGAQIEDNDDLYKRAAMLLAHNDIVTEFDRKPMPINTQQAKTHGFHKIKNVERAFVVDDELHVVVKGAGTQNKLHAIELEVRSLLGAAIGNLKRKRSVIMPKVVKNKAGQTVIKFLLVPDLPSTAEKKEYDVNVTKLNELQELLDLPDDVVHDIKQVLKHRV